MNLITYLWAKLMKKIRGSAIKKSKIDKTSKIYSGTHFVSSEMGSVVTKDVEASSIVAGNPAKKIRMRFKEDVIKSLLTIKWRDFNIKKIIKLSNYIENPERFISEVSK